MFAGVLEAGIQEEAGGRFVQANLTSQENVVVPQGRAPVSIRSAYPDTWLGTSGAIT